jgi:glycine/serine hydroxymethyltransferase
MKSIEMKKIAEWIYEVIIHVKDEQIPADVKERSKFTKTFKEKIKTDKFLQGIKREVVVLCKKFPALGF